MTEMNHQRSPVVEPSIRGRLYIPQAVRQINTTGLSRVNTGIFIDTLISIWILQQLD